MPSEQGKIKKSMTNAERCKKYRESKKNNPAYLEAEKERKRCFRINLSQDQVARNRELAKQRMKKLREKRKNSLGGTTVPLNERQSHTVTRKKREELRKKWRESKQKYRANMSSQKKRRIKEKERQRYMHKKKTARRLVESKEDNGTCPENDNYKTASAARKAVSRIRQKMPKNPIKFSAVINGLVKNATPTKRKALNVSGVIMTPSKKRKLSLFENTMDSFKGTYQKLKESRKKKDIKQRRIMASHLARLKKYRLLRRGSEAMGIRWKSMVGWSKLDFNIKPTKRKDSLHPDQQQLIQDFYLKPEISVTHAGKNTVLKKKQKQRQTMRRSVKASYKIFKKENPSAKVSFSKFAQLRPEHVKTQKHAKMASCLCEKCINVEMMIKALKVQSINDKYDAARLSLCPYPEGELPDIKCAKRKCQNCGTDKLAGILQLESTEPVTWHQWKTEKVEVPKAGETRSKKVLVEHRGETKMLIKHFLEALSGFTYHLYCSSWQHKEFTNLKTNLQEGQVLSVLDFAENYTTLYQDECQSAHWAKKQITIHPVVNYYTQTTEGEKTVTKTYEQVFISDDVKHDYHFVHRVVQKSLEQLRQETRVESVVQFTDGCSGQYKSKVPFMDISFAGKDFGVKFERNYFGSGHGKGPADGCSGVIKSFVARAVTGRTAVVRSAMEFYTFCQEHLTRDHETFKRSFIYLPSEDIDRERKDRTVATTVQGTRDFHCVRSVRPGEILVRKLTCFCESCLHSDGSQCTNKTVVDQWTKKYTGNQTSVAPPEVPEAELQTPDPFLNVPGKDLTDGLLEFDIGEDLRDSTSIDSTYLSNFEGITYPNTLEDAIQVMVEATDMNSIGDVISFTKNTIPPNPFSDAAVVETNAPDPTNIDPILPETSPSTSKSAEFLGSHSHLSVQPGNFVEVQISCGRKFKNFIGLVEEVNVELVRLSYMEQTKTNGLTVYRWPFTSDRSTEPIENIIRVLPEPQLLQNLSNNRIQYFTFN